MIEDYDHKVKKENRESFQLGIDISDNDAAKIVTFLKTLKGKKPAISYPQLPESTLDTEKPSFN